MTLQRESNEDRRRAATYPVSYLSAWYVLCESHELKRGETRYFDCVGEQLVAFRSETDGLPGVLDAHCPHLGANLADGHVVGADIQCPFHEWCFDRCGQVTRIPYATGSISKRLRTRGHAAVDYYGLVCVYLRAEREREQSAPPPYSLPPLAGMDDGRLVYRGRLDGGRVKMHLLEFAENSADMRHFPVLHSQMRVPFTQLAIPYVTINHDASWKMDAEHPHIAYFDDEATLKLFGTALRFTAAQARITMFGPGSLVTFRFNIPKLGEILLFQSHTPEAPLLQRVRFRWYADRSIPRILVGYVVGSWISQWRADVAIWERKIYQARPMLTADDGPIHDLRRWYRQFFPQTAASRVSVPTVQASEPPGG